MDTRFQSSLPISFHCFMFIPQIYKSTRCNDMRQTGLCPRGPFCAFAHVESKYLMPSRPH